MLCFHRNTNLFWEKSTGKKSGFWAFPIALYVLIRYNIGNQSPIRQALLFFRRCGEYFRLEKGKYALSLGGGVALTPITDRQKAVDKGYQNR